MIVLINKETNSHAFVVTNSEHESLRGTKQSNNIETESIMTKSTNLETDSNETTSHAFVVTSRESESPKESSLTLGSKSLRGTKQSNNNKFESL